METGPVLDAPVVPGGFAVDLAPATFESVGALFDLMSRTNLVLVSQHWVLWPIAGSLFRGRVGFQFQRQPESSNAVPKFLFRR